MRNVSTEYLVHAATTHAADPFVAAVVAATEIGIVVPSVLRAKLEAAGFRVSIDDKDDHDKHGFRMFTKVLYRALILKNQQVVAMGAAGDEAEAVLHAALGYVRERDIEKFAAILPTIFHKPPAKDERVKLAIERPQSEQQKANLAAHFEKRGSLE